MHGLAKVPGSTRAGVFKQGDISFAPPCIAVSLTHRSIPEVLHGAVEVRRLPHEGGGVAQVEVAEVIVVADELGGGAAQL